MRLLLGEPLDEPYNAEAPSTAALRKAHQKTRKLTSRRMTILTRYADQRPGCAVVPQRHPGDADRFSAGAGLSGAGGTASGIRVVSVVRSYLN
jgi:hypothetical protein